MRYDSSHKDQTRDRILGEAAAAIRQHGTRGVSVAQLMANAGLTHGGFYAHFGSKDELVAEAILRAFDDSRALSISRIEGKPPAEGLAMLIDGYLSDRARDMPERACPIPSLAGEVARMGPRARERFEEGLTRLRGRIAGLLVPLGHDAAAAEGLAGSLLAEMIGAMTVARALPDAAASSAVLADARARVKARAGVA
jgi:TetR/AcrR family transcriptional regulator, transcriptional repressor for nem operon